jgi:AraC family transcriptional regulator of adaptative response / DNA-3-methyladenine glycosylase II
MPPDFEVAYRAVTTRDGRFDGQFVTAVRTTGIYCRPACPARTPHRRNVTFYPTAAAAQAAGYRACRRCLPDAAPGSPEWNLRADTVGAAMRLIGDGVIDREGVPGLAHRLGYSERHLARMLVAELGASPLALARARRADTARILLTSTMLPISDIAFAAGFSSIRQFNDTIREVYATDPSTLRATRSVAPAVPGTLSLRLPVRAPFHAAALLAFLAARAVPGVEVVGGRSYTRTLRLPAGTGVVTLTFPPDPVVLDPSGPDSPTARATTAISADLRLSHLSDLAPAVDRCRRLLDADADPAGIAAVLRADPALAPAVEAAPGLRLPGAVDGPEILIRALVGQQVSVAAARTALGKLAAAVDEQTDGAEDGPALLFPSPAGIAALGVDAIAGPRKRAAAIIAAATDMATGTLAVHAGRRTPDLTADLVARPGIGAWTAGYVAMRALGDPDVLLTGDLALRHGAAALGLPDDPVALHRAAERWRPFRSYAGMYCWRAAPPVVRRTGARSGPIPTPTPSLTSLTSEGFAS